RLGVPLLLFILLLRPLLTAGHYPQLRADFAEQGVELPYWLYYLLTCDPGPLWFVEVLLVLTLGYLLLHRLRGPRAAVPSPSPRPRRRFRPSRCCSPYRLAACCCPPTPPAGRPPPPPPAPRRRAACPGRWRWPPSSSDSPWPPTRGGYSPRPRTGRSWDCPVRATCRSTSHCSRSASWPSATTGSGGSRAPRAGPGSRSPPPRSPSSSRCGRCWGRPRATRGRGRPSPSPPGRTPSPSAWSWAC